jgi:ketosteroid isomerase-like protein
VEVISGSPSGHEKATVTPALPEVTSDYDGVKLLILRALDIIRSDNFDEYFDLFTDDAIWMMPSSYHDVNKVQARSFYGFTRKFRFDQETTIDELVMEDDWAFVRLSFDGYLRPKLEEGAPPLRSVSRHIWILQRQPDNSWKIARDIWNNPKEIR